MTRYLSLDEVLRFAEAAVGHEPCVRDFGLLESALARPATTVLGRDAYPTVPLKAAALLQSLCANHPLVDGNKRLTWAATAVFLVLNDTPPRVDQDAVVDLVAAVADGSLSRVERIAAEIERLTGSGDGR